MLCEHTHSKKIGTEYANCIVHAKRSKKNRVEWKRSEVRKKLNEVKVERTTESWSKVKSIIWFIKLKHELFGDGGKKEATQWKFEIHKTGKKSIRWNRVQRFQSL